jgi:hypothetical protein
MPILKSFSQFLLEKSSPESEKEKSSSKPGGVEWPLRYKSEVNGKERELSEEYLNKIFLQLNDENSKLVSSEYEALYQFAKQVFDRDINKILNSLKGGKEKEEALKNYYNSVRDLYEKYIGDKKIKDFSDEKNQIKIDDFYKSLLDSFKGSKEKDSFYEAVNSIYGKSEIDKLPEIDYPKLLVISTDFINADSDNPILSSSILKISKELEAQNKEFEKAVEEGGKDTISFLLQQILYCFSSSYGCLAQINRLTFISASVDRAKKEELLGKYKSTGEIEVEGTIYKNLQKLTEEFNKISEKGVKDVKKSYFLDSGNQEGVKYLVTQLQEDLKELQKISDDSVMTQTDWENYVKDQKMEGFRYQDLKEAFGILQSAVNNYCTGENQANAFELYYTTLEDYIKG